ncbi:MAG: calcium-binding protein, partial [Proteobacteria bacterium]|nr:calcium-binding protein [Pseudomonadota bacterium]
MGCRSQEALLILLPRRNMMPFVTVRSVPPLTPGNGTAYAIVGHTWVEISESIVSLNGKTESYGYYPESLSPVAPGVVRHTDYDDFAGHGFSSQKFYITENQAQRLRLYAIEADASIYALLPNQLLPVDNCATFAYQAMSRAGVSAVIPIRDIIPWWLPALFDLESQINNAVTTTFHAATSFSGAAPPFLFRSDPLTLDLDNDGLETVGINPSNPIFFDHNADGVKTATGWVKPDDGLLVLDRNGNGVIDNGAELFGDNTPLYGGGFALDGFGALVQEDTNADGRVDAGDARFGQLRIWRDQNQDGISQATELHTLGQEGIVALKVAKTEHIALLNNGNQIADLGGFVRTDGSGGTLGIAEQLGDIDLISDPFYRQFNDHVTLSESAGALPEMQGSGLVRNLREAASLPSAEGAELAARLSEYSAAATRAEQLTLLDGLVQAWAATSAMTGRGNDPLYIKSLAWHGVLVDGRVQWALEEINRPLDQEPGQRTLTTLKVVEAFNGNLVPGNSFFSEQIALLEQSRAAIESSVYGGLVLQTRLKPYLDAINLNISESGVTLDYAGMMALLDVKKAGDLQNAVFDLLDLYKYASSQLTGWDGSGALEGWSADPVSGTAVISALLAAGFSSVSGNWFGVIGDDSVLGSSGVDHLSGNVGNDLIMGGAGNDVLVGNSGSDTLLGGDGNDTLMAGSNTFVNPNTTDSTENTANTLEGDAGADRLFGSGGSETYRFNQGDGADTIYEVAYNNVSATDTAIDRIVLGSGILPSDVTVMREAYDLILKFATAGDQITIANWYGPTDRRIEQVAFVDGTVWDRTDLHRLGLVVNGTAGADKLFGLAGENDVIKGADGNDTLIGDSGSDTLIGGAGADNLVAGIGTFANQTVADPTERTANLLEGNAGADRLYGSGGSETYRYNAGDGADTIYEVAYNNDPNSDTAIDRIVLGGGITQADVTVARNNYDLILKFANGEDQITIVNWYSSSSNRVEQLVFDDGTIWDRIKLHSAGLNFVGTPGNDTLYGLTGEDDLLGGGDGNDLLAGSTGSDTLMGGLGNDVLVAGMGSFS